MELDVSPTGLVTGIYADLVDVRTLGKTTIIRASHVEADDTGQWYADIIDGPSLGPFGKRCDAVAAEIEWLKRHFFRAE